MTPKSLIARLTQQDDLNFLLTNRIPRGVCTHFMGWLSRIEQPQICSACIALWRLFSDLDLSEARKTQFNSVHDCFIRELKEGARPIDGREGILVSPCDGLVGACGRVGQGAVLQAKGSTYPLAQLLADAELARYYEGGQYTTLRLTSGMY